GGFGVSDPDDLLLVADFVLIQQICTSVTVKFDDLAVAWYFDDQVDRGLQPVQFARLWVHTHPGDCPLPSRTDEDTFARVFGHTDWAVMFILAAGGQTYCRLHYHVGPTAAFELGVEIDYRADFDASDHQAWEHEYLANVMPFEFGLDTFGGHCDPGF